MKWYESNVECMTKRGIEVLVVEYHKNINNEIFFCTSTKDTMTPIEEGAESCPMCKSKMTISIDV